MPEKALLDTIYLRRRIPFHDELYLDNVDRDALMSMANSFPATVKTRLIELMEDAQGGFSREWRPIL